MSKESSSGQQSSLYSELKTMLESNNPEFPQALQARTERAQRLSDVLALHMLQASDTA